MLSQTPKLPDILPPNQEDFNAFTPRQRSLSQVKLPLLKSRETTNASGSTQKSPRRSRKSRRKSKNAMTSASENGIGSKLLSRAQTLLRGATIRRDSDAISALSGDVTARNFGPVISDLQREKTSLESRLFPEANMKEVGAFFDAQRKPKEKGCCGRDSRFRLRH